MDIAEHIKAKSDQINAADLIGGPITVQIEAVKRGNADQPVIVHVSGGHMPWKPSKTALRALAHFLGTDTTAWVGRWVRLYRDPRTLWAGRAVGGVMVSGLSGIPRAESLSLPYSRGKMQEHRIEPIPEGHAGESTASLTGLLEDHGLTIEALDAWAVSKGKPPASELDDAKRAQTAVWLGKHPEVIAEIRVLAEGGAE